MGGISNVSLKEWDGSSLERSFTSLRWKSMQLVTSKSNQIDYSVGRPAVCMIFFFWFVHNNVPTQSTYSYCLSDWPSLQTTVSQGRCKWLNLRRQFTCLLVLIQTDEWAVVFVCVCLGECWWERKMERPSARCWHCASVRVHPLCVGLRVCLNVIAGRSAKVGTFLPCISDELRSPRELLVFM